MEIEKSLFGEFLEAYSQHSVTRQLTFNRTKIVGKCQKWSIWRVFQICNLRYNRVTKQVTFNWPKIGEKCQCQENQMRHFQQFSNNV